MLNISQEDQYVYTFFAFFLIAFFCLLFVLIRLFFFQERNRKIAEATLHQIQRDSYFTYFT